MSTSRLDRLASAASDELLDTTAAETDTFTRRAELDRLRRSRRGAQLTAVAVAMAAVLIVVIQVNFVSDSTPQPMEPVPGIDIGDVPVWYDDAGLHRGDVVEQTPVELRQLDDEGSSRTVRWRWCGPVRCTWTRQLVMSGSTPGAASHASWDRSSTTGPAPTQTATSPPGSTGPNWSCTTPLQVFSCDH